MRFDQLDRGKVYGLHARRQTPPRARTRATVPNARHHVPEIAQPFGTASTYCRTDGSGKTRSVRCAAVSAMRRQLQEGQPPQPLRENAIRISGVALGWRSTVVPTRRRAGRPNRWRRLDPQRQFCTRLGADADRLELTVSRRTDAGALDAMNVASASWTAISNFWSPIARQNGYEAFTDVRRYR